MGLMNFVKSAGKKLFGGNETALTEAGLQAEIKELGLDAEGLDITIDGDTVKVSGAAVSQEVKEKILLAVGNVEGVAAVDDAVEGGEGVYHTVVKGDSLWKISQATLGDGNRYPDIFEANKPMLSDPDKIYPGQVLRIPQ